MTDDQLPMLPDTEKRRRIKPSVTTALVLGFGTLMLVGMVIVQGITMWSAQKNTRELLAENAHFAVLSLVRETRRHLAPVRELTEYLTRMIDTGQIDLDDRKTLAETLLTSMAGTDQVFGMGFIYPDGRIVRVQRGRGQLSDESPNIDQSLLPAINVARQRFQPYWEQPIWLPEVEATMISIRSPIWEGDIFRGMLVTAVTVNALSRFIARSGAVPLADNRFVLYGRDHVLAHRNMERGKFKRQSDIPLPALQDVSDPVLAKL